MARHDCGFGAVSLEEPFFPYGEMGDDLFEERFQRLMQAVKANSAAELAKTLGIKHQAVSAARKRRQVPLNWMLLVSEGRGVSLDWLFYGQGEMRLPDEKGPPPPTIVSLEGYARPLGERLASREPSASDGFAPKTVYEAGQLVVLPRVSPRLHPGSVLLEKDEVQPGVAFQHFWLTARGQVRGMVVMEMQGTHMEPTIAHKSLLLLDRSRTEVVPGGIYALAFGTEVVIKRLDRLPGSLVLISDNHAVPPREVPWPADEPVVLARVLWAARDLG